MYVIYNKSNEKAIDREEQGELKPPCRLSGPDPNLTPLCSAVGPGSPRPPLLLAAVGHYPPSASTRSATLLTAHGLRLRGAEVDGQGEEETEAGEGGVDTACGHDAGTLVPDFVVKVGHTVDGTEVVRGKHEVGQGLADGGHDEEERDEPLGNEDGAEEGVDKEEEDGDGGAKGGDSGPEAGDSLAVVEDLVAGVIGAYPLVGVGVAKEACLILAGRHARELEHTRARASFSIGVGTRVAGIDVGRSLAVALSDRGTLSVVSSLLVALLVVVLRDAFVDVAVYVAAGAVLAVVGIGHVVSIARLHLCPRGHLRVREVKCLLGAGLDGGERHEGARGRRHGAEDEGREEGEEEDPPHQDVEAAAGHCILILRIMRCRRVVAMYAPGPWGEGRVRGSLGAP